MAQFWTHLTSETLQSSSPAAGLPSLAAETLRALARLSALYLVSESAYLSDGLHKFKGRQPIQKMVLAKSGLLLKSSFLL